MLARWWFFTNPFETYAQVKLDHLPQGSGRTLKKYFKTAPSWLIKGIFIEICFADIYAQLNHSGESNGWF